MPRESPINRTRGYRIAVFFTWGHSESETMINEQEQPKDQHLIDAIKEQGGYVAKKPDAWDTTKSISSALGDQHIHFYPQFPKVDWSSLVDQIFRVLAIKIIEDWDDIRFGKSTFPLLLIDFEDGRKCTTLGSGRAILNQCKKLQAAKVLPVKVRLTMKASDNPTGQPYYYMDGV